MIRIVMLHLDQAQYIKNVAHNINKTRQCFQNILFLKALNKHLNVKNCKLNKESF